MMQDSLDRPLGMRWLLKLSRIAFVCNICFLLGFSLTLTNWIHNQDLEGTIIIIGYVLVIVFNPLVNLCYLVLLIMNRKFWKVVPPWLFTANAMFLIMQLFFILYLNNDKQPA